MTPSGRTVSVIVLSYLLFGLFSLFQFGSFVVPVTYNELVTFIIVTVVFFQNQKQLKLHHLFLFVFALSEFILHPFMWEIFLDQEQQYKVYSGTGFDILRIVKWISLSVFFVLTTYRLKPKKPSPEWLLPAILAAGSLFNPPHWYFPIPFIAAGILAFWQLRKGENPQRFLLEILVGLGLIHLVNVFYFVCVMS